MMQASASHVSTGPGRLGDRLDDADEPRRAAPVDELLDHLDAPGGGLVGAVDDEQLHRDSALLAHRDRVDVVVDLDRGHELAVAGDEVVGGSDEPAGRRNRTGVDDGVEGELLVDEHRGGEGSEAPAWPPP